MPYSEARRRYERHIRKFVFGFDSRKDSRVIKAIEASGNFTDYVRRLVREDVAAGGARRVPLPKDRNGRELRVGDAVRDDMGTPCKVYGMRFGYGRDGWSLEIIYPKQGYALKMNVEPKSVERQGGDDGSR